MEEGKKGESLDGTDRLWLSKSYFRVALPSFFVHCCSLLFVLLFVSAASPTHEYHVSVTQMQYNASLKSLEVSIRLFTDDLEVGLAAENANKRFVVKNNDQNDSFVEKLVKRSFILTDSHKKAVPVRYIGKEQEEDGTWVYLEIQLQGALEGYKLQNSILTEAFEDQVNMTNLSLSSGKKTFLFKKGQLVHSL